MYFCESFANRHYVAIKPSAATVNQSSFSHQTSTVTASNITSTPTSVIQSTNIADNSALSNQQQGLSRFSFYHCYALSLLMLL